jgi:hypothetical protein
MRFTANFLLSLANLVIIYSCPARADEPCDSTFGAALGSLVFGGGGDCAAVDGACPTSCGDLFAGVYAACKGNTLTDDATGVEAPFSPANLLGLGTLLKEGCEDVPLEFAFSNPNDLTCSEWLDINQFTAFFVCSEECTDTCKAIIDNVYAGCSATDTITNFDDGDVSTAQEIEFFASISRNDDCDNFADTKSFKTESSPTNAAPAESPPTSAPAGDGGVVVVMLPACVGVGLASLIVAVLL